MQIYREKLAEHDRLIRYYAHRYAIPPLQYDDLYQEGSLLLYELVIYDSKIVDDKNRLARRLINRFVDLYDRAHRSQRDLRAACCVLYDCSIENDQLLSSSAEDMYLVVEQQAVSRWALSVLYSHAEGDAYALLAALDATLECPYRGTLGGHLASVLGWQRMRVHRALRDLQKVVMGLRIEESEMACKKRVNEGYVLYTEFVGGVCPNCNKVTTEYEFHFKLGTNITAIDSWPLEEKYARALSVEEKCTPCGYGIKRK